MADDTQQTAAQSQDLSGAASVGKPQGESPVPAPTANTAFGIVQAFREIRRELTEEDLKHPGVQKLILDRLDAALAQCALLSSFESRYYDRDKRVAVLEEKDKKRLALDIAWTVGVSVGLAFVALAPVVWGAEPTWVGRVFLAVGLILIIGGIAVRVVLR